MFCRRRKKKQNFEEDVNVNVNKPIGWPICISFVSSVKEVFGVFNG